MVKLTMIQFGVKSEFYMDSVQEAVHCARAAVDMNEAAPVSIEENGVMIWKNEGPKSYETLWSLINLSD